MTSARLPLPDPCPERGSAPLFPQAAGVPQPSLWWSLGRNRLVWLGSACLALIVAVTLLPLVLSMTDPLEQNGARQFARPGPIDRLTGLGEAEIGFWCEREAFGLASRIADNEQPPDTRVQDRLSDTRRWLADEQGRIRYLIHTLDYRAAAEAYRQLTPRLAAETERTCDHIGFSAGALRELASQVVNLELAGCFDGARRRHFEEALGAAGPKEAAPIMAQLSTALAQEQAAAEAKQQTLWLGADHLGRDQLSRFAHGGRISLFIGLVAISLALFLGVPLGLISGYYGGWIDQLIMRAVDIALAFPSFLLALAIMAVLGQDMWNVILAVGLVNVPIFIRQIRASALSVKEMEFVLASRALGARDGWLMGRVLLPNCIAPIIVLATLSLGSAILSASGLSFLGIGIEPGTPEWGSMLSGTREYMQNAPWVVVAPGLAITLTVLGFNLLGDGLRDVLDPRRHC